MKTEGRGKYLLKNTAVFALSNFGTKIIAFFLVPIYTGILSTTEYGTVDLIYTLVTVLVPILTLNVAEAIMRFSLDKYSNQYQIMSLGIAIWIGVLFVGLLVIPVTMLFSEIRPYALYLYLYIISFSGSQICLCFLRGKELLIRYSIGNILNSVLIAFLNILFLLIIQWGVRGYFIAYIGSNFVTMIYAAIAGDVKAVFRKFHIHRALSKQMLIYSAILIPNSFMWWIMNSSDRIMITAIVGVAANGIYAISYKIPTLLSTITTIFTQAWSYSAIKEKDSDDMDTYSNIVYGKMVQSVLFIGTALLFIMKPFMRIYVANEYYEAWRYTPFLIVGLVFMTLSTFLATSYIVHKDSKGFVLSGLIGAIINVFLNWILIPKIGVYGAALATSVAYFSVYLYRVFDTKRYIRLTVVSTKYVIGLFDLLVSCLVLYMERYSQISLVFLLLVQMLLSKEIFIDFIKVITRLLQLKFPNKV